MSWRMQSCRCSLHWVMEIAREALAVVCQLQGVFVVREEVKFIGLVGKKA